MAVGVVDVRRAFQPERAVEAVPLDEFRSNLRTMTDEPRAAGAQVLILEPIGHLTAAGGCPGPSHGGPGQLAKECGVDCVELFQPLLRFQARLRHRTPPETMYADEIHLNPLGDMKYAELVFDFFSERWREGSLRHTPEAETHG